MHHHVAGENAALWPLITLLWALLLYLLAATVPRQGKKRWSRGRTASFIAGILLLAIALSPPVDEWAHRDLRGHMAQHLLIGMFAPLGLVLAAPVTLALRVFPVAAARRVVSLLRSRPARWIAHPVVALALNSGGMFLLYLTPLYAATITSPMLHHLAHLHFLAAGSLFVWVVAGSDPSPHRAGFTLRLGVLFISMASHATLGKLMYAHLLPRGTSHSAEEIRAAAQLMYHGGDMAELLLAVALFATWYRKRPRTHAPVPDAGGRLVPAQAGEPHA